MKRNEIAQSQNNMFQNQRRELYDRDQNEQGYSWGPPPQYSGGDLRYQGQHRSNWEQQWSQPRWNSFNRGYNQYPTGPLYYQSPRQNYPENEWNRVNAGRNLDNEFQRRPLGDHRQAGYRNNTIKNENLIHQNNESQEGEEHQHYYQYNNENRPIENRNNQLSYETRQVGYQTKFFQDQSQLENYGEADMNYFYQRPNECNSGLQDRSWWNTVDQRQTNDYRGESILRQQLQERGFNDVFPDNQQEDKKQPIEYL